jgi:hypothetical protein
VELLIFFRKVLLLPSKYVIPWDFQYYAFNQTQFLAESLRNGHFPLWDPYTYCGMAFFANIQAQVFYPPTLATAILSNIIDPHRLLFFMAAELVLHIFAAGVFTFMLLRELDCSPLPAFFGATAFQLGCYFASQTQHYGAILGSVWLPFSFLAVIRLSRGRSFCWMAMLALSLGMPILAGYPSAIFPDFLCTAVLALALIVRRQAKVELLAHTLVAGIGALGLAAIQLLPTIQIARISVSRYRGDWRKLGSGGLPLEALPSLIWPNYHHILDLNGYKLPYNFTFLYLYCGLLPLAFALWALMRRRNRYAAPFLIVTLVSALLMFGNKTAIGRPVTALLLDFVHDTVYPEFLMLGVSLGVAVLAGLGAQRLAGRRVLLSVLTVSTIFDLTYFGSCKPMNTSSLKNEPGVTPVYFDGSRELLREVRSRVNQEQPPWRLETYNDAMGWTSMSPTIRIPTPNGNDPFALIPYMAVRRIYTGGTRWGRYYQITDLKSAVLDLLNVRYLMSREPLPETTKYRMATQLPGHFLYENKSALPRFFLVTRTIRVLDQADGTARMSAPEFDPMKVAFVQGTEGRDFPPGDAGSVRTVRYDQNECEVETLASQPRFLVTSEAQYPGWQATIDGKEAAIVSTNIAFRGLEIPAGRHLIAFRFNPPVLWWGALISVLSLAAFMFALTLG